MAGFDQTSLNSALQLSKTSFTNTIGSVVDEIFNGVDVSQEVKDKVKENYEKVFNKTTDSITSVLYSKLNEIISNKAKVIVDGITYRIQYDS